MGEVLRVRCGLGQYFRGRKVGMVAVAGLTALGLAGSAGGQTVTWNNAAGGLWQVDANWDTLSQPNAVTDDVVILNPLNAATPVVVTLNSGVTRSTGTITINDTGIPGKHQLIVANSAFLHVSGDTLNAGEIRLASTGVTARYGILADLTLSGDGEMILSGVGAQISDTGGSQNILTHASGHTIRGEGSFGANSMGLINKAGATVSADVNGSTLVLDPGGTHGFTNAGTMQAINGGLLVLTGSAGGAFDNTGGDLGAFGVGSELQLTTAASVTGGTFSTDADGLINVLDNQAVDFIGSTFAANSNVRVGNNSDARYAGTISHQGTTTLDAAANSSDIRINGDVMLTGGGTIVMTTSGAGSAFIADTGGPQNILTNVDNTIRGQGNVGGNSAGLANQAGGTISADVNGATLVIDPGSTHGATNAGAMQAVNGGTLQISGSGGGNLDNTGGTIDADGAGSRVELSNIVVTGGDVRSLNGGTVETLDARTVNLTDVDFTGTHNVGSNADLILTTTHTNAGTINLNPGASNTDLRINGNVTLDGGGTVVMNASGAAGVAVVNDGGGTQDILTNVDNTIRGTGNLGFNTLGLINQAGGLVLADQTGADLFLDPGATHGYANQGTFRAANGASLTLSGSGGGSFDNTGGTIEATGAGSQVRLTTTANLTNGVLRGVSGGTVETLDTQTVTLTDIDFVGTHNVGNNADLILTTTHTNAGTINLNPGASNSDLRINGNVTLDGGGTVVLNASGGAAFAVVNDGGGSQDILTNVDNTIRGTGNLGFNTLGLINQAGGLVLADQSGADLFLDPGATHGFANQGTFRATSGASLTLSGSGTGSFDNAGGLIEATGAGSQVRLVTSVNVSNGDLRGVSGGTIESADNQSVFLADVTVTGTHNVGNNTDLHIAGTYTNTGTTSLNPFASNTDLRINGDVTLDGGGTILLNPTAGGGGISIINDGGGAQNRLTNVNNTIRGTGNLGANLMSVTNQAGGTILADGGANGLTIDPGSVLVGGQTPFLNQGLVRATNNTTLLLTGNGFGAFENAAGGTIDIDAGSTLELSAALTHRQGAAIDQAGVLTVLNGGNLINEADDYSPGASPGLVTVNSGGTFTNASSGTVTFELDGATTPGVDYDSIRGDGVFTLAGTLDLDLNFSPTYYESIELIRDTAGNNVTGTFEQLGFDPIVAPGDALAITYEPNAVLLTRALPGDANLDQFISQGDLDAVLLNWGSTTSTWSTGEMSGDDFVSQADLDLVLLNWGTGTPPAVVIPEPTSLTLCGLAGLALVARRRRD